MNPAERGFTLVELMVAVLIFGILSGAGVALLTMSARSQAAVAGRLDEVAADRRVSALIAADLVAAVPRITRDALGAPRPPFVGNPAAGDPPVMGFVRSGWTNPDGAARASLQKVDYRFEGGRLERVAYPALDGSEPGPPAVLLEGIETLSVRYRTADGWRDRWDPNGPVGLPAAVELVVTPAGRAPVRQLFLVGAGR